MLITIKLSRIAFQLQQSELLIMPMHKMQLISMCHNTHQINLTRSLAS